MVIGAQHCDVVRFIRALMPATQRADVVRLGVVLTAGQQHLQAADLAAVLVFSLERPRYTSIAYNSVGFAFVARRRLCKINGLGITRDQRRERAGHFE